MGILVKICGINDPVAADAAVAAGADFVGLVFHPASPRYVGLDAAASLAARVRGRVRIVALSVDAGDEDVAAIVGRVRPDLLQLHGAESPARAAALKSRHGLGVIKAIAVAEAADFESAAAYQDAADMLLFDAKPPKTSTRSGGHGAAFDWRLLRGRKFPKPWLLAGGLTPSNVSEAISVAEPPGVDVSSGVETAPGRKSAELIAAFAAAARTAHIPERSIA